MKWAGGKGQLLKAFEAYYPETFKRYFEPFIGGGAVYFELGSKVPKLRATISDYNDELINAYQTVQGCVEELILELRKHQNDSEHFYKVRALDTTKLSPIARAARLIYLNKTCFNGLYRVNRSGQFNVPFGKYKNPRIVDETNLRMASELLQNTEIYCCGFDDTLKRAKKGDFVYLDPPYQPISTTSNFTSYTAKSFSAHDQERLADFVQRLHKRGCYVMVSNSDNELITSLYRDFNIHRVLATRAINCKGNLRGRISELVITNY